MIGDGILWDATEREAEEAAKALDHWNSLAENHQFLVSEIERKDKALLLAARWFKLHFDDETLNDHPPSKADLAGMFDAMLEACLNKRKESDNV